VLGVEPNVLHVLDKRSTTELYPQPLLTYFNHKIQIITLIHIEMLNEPIIQLILSQIQLHILTGYVHNLSYYIILLTVLVQSVIRRLPNSLYPTGKNPWQDM
jgi:hypothetical protein